jgi:hypothetical protein
MRSRKLLSCAFIVNLFGMSGIGRCENAEFLFKREVTTSMFILGYSNNGPELTGLRLAYIPPEFQSRCWTRSAADCKALVQAAGNFSSTGPLPAKYYEVSVSREDGSDRAKTALDSAAKKPVVAKLMSNAEDGPHDHALPTIERAVKLRALVRWEGWTNGDGIKRVVSIP